MSDKKALFSGRTGDNSPPARPTKQVDTAETKLPISERQKPKSPPTPGIGVKSRGIVVNAERRHKQLKEAEVTRKAANKRLQKTITRWNSDFFSAAPLFEKSAACYRAAGDDAQAMAMFVTAGECHSHESVMAPASAAKDFKEAALIMERQGRDDEAATLYLRCAEAWISADEAGRAAECFGRSAKLVATDDEDAASERYIQASKVMVPEGSDVTSNFVRVVGSMDVFVQGIRFFASANRLPECIEVVERYCIILMAEGFEHSFGRMCLTYCVLALAQGDYVKANAAFRDVHLQNTTYLQSEECRVEEDLLTAFKKFDPQLLQKVQLDRTLRRLDPSIVTLAKSLKIDDDEGEIPANKEPSGTAANVKARVRALREVHGLGKSSPPPSSPSNAPLPAVPACPPETPSTSEGAAASCLPPAIPSTGDDNTGDDGSDHQFQTTAANIKVQDGDGDIESRSKLLGDERVCDEDRELAISVGAGAATAASIVPTYANESHDVQEHIDFDLGDLEASLMGENSGGEDVKGDDLEAIIEAARKDTNRLREQEELEQPEDEDDIDLT